MINSFFKTVIDYYMQHISYVTVMGLMAIESSFIPFPSEVVIPPAAWKAAQGDLNLWLILLSGTSGALIGALFNYYVALLLGRALIYKVADTKIAHLLLINRKSVEKAEAYFNRYGRSSTFIGRLVPAIRQLISLPAGLARMNVRDFIIFTTLGSGLWNGILATLGYFLYTQKALLNRYYTEISYLFIVLGIGFVLFLTAKSHLGWRAQRRKRWASERTES